MGSCSDLQRICRVAGIYEGSLEGLHRGAIEYNSRNVWTLRLSRFPSSTLLPFFFLSSLIKTE